MSKVFEPLQKTKN